MSEGRLTGSGVQGGGTELGRMLKEGRAERGLELADVAELTHIRQDYLRALEEGRYEELPEDVYSRNFVRLYAQAVGVPASEALSTYQSERQRAGGLSTIEERLEKERRGEPPPPPKRRRLDAPRGPRIGPTVLTVLLVFSLVGLAVWGYNSLFFRGATTPNTLDSGSTGQLLPSPTQAVPAQPEAQPSTQQGGAATQPAASAGTVLIDVTSSPPGARVSIDGFQLPGVTPIRSAPVTARADRTMRVVLEGYEPWEESVDLSEGRAIEVDLTQVAPAAGDAPATPSVAQGQLALNITAPSWLEVYRGGARNQGERLVYTTAQPGASFTFDLPVYVYVGNGAGVEVTVGDAPPFVMGSSGAIVGRAFQ
ncbi:MAG: RodZ domain-containing protein [Trueperaceae bacterium]